METIIGIENEAFDVVGIQNNDNRPTLKAHLIAKGFDGKIYNLRRIISGRKQKSFDVLCYRGASSGQFQPMI